MLAPRTRARAGCAIAFSVASLSVVGGLTRSVSADRDNHSEQGLVSPSPGQFGVISQVVLAGYGAVMVAPGPGVHGFDTRLYVLLPDHGVIVQVDPSGALSQFTRLPAHVMKEAMPLTFDVQGNYGRVLLFGTTQNRIGQVNASGTISWLRMPEIGRPGRNVPETRGLTCDPYGVFDGRLFLADDADAIFEIDEQGRRMLLSSGRGVTSGGCGGGAMVVSPGGAFGAFLYVAEKAGRRILRISPDHESGEAVSVWRDLSDVAIEPSGLAISASGPFGTDVMYVLDRKTDRVVGFAADGTLHRTLNSGQKNQSLIELPRTGMFRHIMVIASRDAISIIRPADSPAYKHHPGPLGDLDDDHDVDEADLIALLDDLDCVGPGCVGDLNEDGRTDAHDIDVFLHVMQGFER